MQLEIIIILLIFGLVLSIILMATAATLISKWIKEYKWIAWAGLLAILVVAIDLIYTDIKNFIIMFLKKYNLKNKTAVVSGAGKGLGRACAIALAEAGANLIIISRTKKDLDSVSKTIKKFKSKSKSYVCDITDYEQIKSIINKQTKIDILVNNAGNNIPEHFTKVKTKNMEHLVRINTIATFNLAQLCSLKMIKAKK